MGFWDVGPFDNSAAEELVEDLRLRCFNLDQFLFRCEETSALDADDAAMVIALNALIQDPYRRPAGIGQQELAGIDTPYVRGWLKAKMETICAPHGSSLYAHWESIGEVEEWLAASRCVVGVLR